jgi:trigger factor
MQVTETPADGLKRAYQVVVPAADLAARRDARLAELSKTLKIPGFRPGKVPVSLVKQRYGQAVMGEILEGTVDETARKIVADNKLKPAQQPQIKDLKFEDGQDLAFTMALEVLPEIAIPDLKGISLEKLTSEPEDDTITKALETIASRNRETVPVAETRPAVKGDIVVADFEGSIDGEKFDGGAMNDAEIEIGSGQFIPGFEDGVLGMSAGETRTIDVTFPEGYGAENLAGKAAKFLITAKALKAPVLPAIDDEFAKKLGLADLAALKEAVKKQIQRDYDQLSRMRIKRALLDQLAEKAEFQAPEGMVDGEFNAIWQRVEADMKAGRLDEDDKGKDEDTLKADYRKISERRVKLGLLLAEIGRANSIQVGQDELSRAMQAEASRFPGQQKQVFDYFAKNPQAVEGLRAPIFEEKVVDFVLELASVTEKKVPPAELSAEPEAA